MIDFKGLNITVDPDLVGSKYAIKEHGILFISPAMFTLLKDERTRPLMRNLKFLDLDEQHGAPKITPRKAKRRPRE